MNRHAYQVGWMLWGVAWVLLCVWFWIETTPIPHPIDVTPANVGSVTDPREVPETWTIICAPPTGLEKKCAATAGTTMTWTAATATDNPNATPLEH